MSAADEPVWQVLGLILFGGTLGTYVLLAYRAMKYIDTGKKKKHKKRAKTF
jgi:hypothetical protein